MIDTLLAQVENFKPMGFLILQFVLLIVGSLIARIVAALILKRFAKNSVVFVSTTVQGGIVLGGAYFILLANGVSPVLLLAVLAILTAGVSLSADSSFSNFLAGLTVTLDGRISIGEQVTVGDITGVVVRVGLMNTLIQVNTRGMVTLSNRTVCDSTLVNHSRLKDGIELSMVFPIHSFHDRRAAIALIRAKLKDNQFIHPGIRVLHDWVGGAECYAIVFRALDYGKRREIASDISLVVTEALIENGYPLGVINSVKQV